MGATEEVTAPCNQALLQCIRKKRAEKKEMGY